MQANVFDASALVALLRSEAGASVVRDALRDNPGSCFVHALNLCEIYYGYYRTSGQTTAELAIRLLLNMGLKVREDMDMAFWKDVGTLKATNHVSVADACCLALGRRLNAQIYTADHHEFDALLGKKICLLTFIR